MPRSLAWPIAALVASLQLATASYADADTSVPVRIGTHPGYGRVVFDLSPRMDYRVTRQGQRVLVQFTGDVTIAAARGVPRNVISISGGTGQAELVVAPGTVLHDWRLGDMVVIDVLDRDPTAGASAPVEAAAPQPPNPAGSAQSTPVSATVSPPAEAAAPPLPQKTEATNPQPQPTSPPQPPQGASSAPSAPPPAQPDTGAVATTEAGASGDGGLVVSADAQVGVALVPRGNAALIVFDRSLAIDTAPLRDDPVFGSATAQVLQTATVLRVQLDAGTMLSALYAANSWHVRAVTREPALRPIQAVMTEDRVALSAAAPGTVVSIADPDTGATILIGTQRRGGQGVPVERRLPEFTLLPTWQGVAVVPKSDALALRPTSQGFVIAGAVTLSPASDIADQLAHSAGLTRQFDFPAQPTEVLLQRLRRQVTEDAARPPLARGPPRQAIARSMIALGLGAEASAMLHLAAGDDPHEAASPENAALGAIAALLAHRPDEANGLADPRLTTADDIVLWRAVRLAELQEGSAPAAAMFSATLPLLLAYPAEIRDRLLPLAAETLVAGGEINTAAALLDSRKTDVTLDLARAMLSEARGDGSQALASYDRLAQSADRSVYARAASRAVELRLALGTIDARQAAAGLERLLYSWRGDQRERALRERLAELDTRIGAWRSALVLLRETETLFPDDAAAIHAELADTFARMLRDDAADSLSPLELVSVVEENADLLPAGPDGEVLEAKLADRLVALDLPKRAGPVLQKLAQAAKSGVARAGFGARLAALRLREGDATGALEALDASVAADLPAELVERRTLLVAAANARRGDNERALAALGTLDSAVADEARATILERANDWPAAQRALADYAAKTVPPEGALTDAQRRTLLRLATAAARAGDAAALAALREREGPRMGAGPLADMFRLLTADQVRGVADLKRSGQEAALARALPAELKALQPSAR